VNTSELPSPGLIPIDVTHLDRLVAALGLVNANPGRQIRRDARGWRESELHLARILIGVIRPAFEPPVTVATALVDTSWQATALLGEDLIGPIQLDAQILDAVILAWPPPGAWSEGRITVDGAQVDLMLSSLGASTRLRFMMTADFNSLSASVAGLLHAIADRTGAALLRSWLSESAAALGEGNR